MLSASRGVVSLRRGALAAATTRSAAAAIATTVRPHTCEPTAYEPRSFAFARAPARVCVLAGLLGPAWAGRRGRPGARWPGALGTRRVPPIAAAAIAWGRGGAVGRPRFFSASTTHTGRALLTAPLLSVVGSLPPCGPCGRAATGRSPVHRTRDRDRSFALPVHRRVRTARASPPGAGSPGIRPGPIARDPFANLTGGRSPSSAVAPCARSAAVRSGTPLIVLGVAGAAVRERYRRGPRRRVAQAVGGGRFGSGAASLRGVHGPAGAATVTVRLCLGPRTAVWPIARHERSAWRPGVSAARGPSRRPYGAVAPSRARRRRRRNSTRATFAARLVRANAGCGDRLPRRRASPRRSSPAAASRSPPRTLDAGPNDPPVHAARPGRAWIVCGRRSFRRESPT